MQYNKNFQQMPVRKQRRGQQKFFIPNFNPYGPQNLRIYPQNNKKKKKSKNRNRNNQDFKFTRQPTSLGFTKLNNPNPIKRVSESIVLPISNCSGTIMIAPCHPLFWNTRMFNLARSYTGYKIEKFNIRYIPKCPTSDVTSNTLSSTQNCASISQDLQNITNTLQNMGGVTGSAYQPLTLGLVCQDKNRIYPIIPMLATDLPFTGIIANTSSTVTGKGDLYIDVGLSLYGSYNGDDISVNLPIQLTLTLAAGDGIKCSAITTPFYGIVISSTCPSVDLLELIVSPGFVGANTNYTDHIVTHNMISLAPLSETNDRGVVIILALGTN